METRKTGGNGRPVIDIGDDMDIVKPVAPSGLELIFVYECPHCGQKNVLISPTSPRSVKCENCQNVFPILPVNERSVQYVKLMMGNGYSAVDLDYF